MTGLIWLQSWGPLYAVLHRISMGEAAERMSAAAAMPGGEIGISLVAQAGIRAVASDVAVMSGYLSMSVPFLAAALAYGLSKATILAISVLAVGQDAASSAAHEGRLDEFETCWGGRYPAIAPAWRCAWEHVVPMFAFPPTIRKMIYTTNALESLHRSLRKIIKTRGSFPSDEAATKLLFLAIRNAGVHWRGSIEWTAAMGQFAILFEDRFPASAR